MDESGDRQTLQRIIPALSGTGRQITNVESAALAANKEKWAGFCLKPSSPSKAGEGRSSGSKIGRGLVNGGLRVL